MAFPSISPSAHCLSKNPQSLAARDEELLPGLCLRLCTAEDPIVFKAFAGRALDWRDVEMTIVRQGEGALDWTYIEESLLPLAELKEKPETLGQLADLRRSLREL